MTLEELAQEVEDLKQTVNGIRSCTCDPSKYANAEEFAMAYQRILDLETAVSKIKSCTCDPSRYASAEDFAVVQRNMQALEDAVAGLVNVPEFKLPYTASELVEKLGDDEVQGGSHYIVSR